MSVMPFMVLYIADELGKVTSGILMSANVIFGLICNLVGGYFADRFSRNGVRMISLMLIENINLIILNKQWKIPLLIFIEKQNICSYNKRKDVRM